MATLTDTPGFTANEVYELDGADPVEGAASGASFGGIGKDNQPHQQLANRTAYLKTAVETLAAAFKVNAIANGGYLEIQAYQGVSKLPIVIQWGRQAWTAANANVAVAINVNWPRAYTTFLTAGCWPIWTAAGEPLYFSTYYLRTQSNIVQGVFRGVATVTGNYELGWWAVGVIS